MDLDVLGIRYIDYISWSTHFSTITVTAIRFSISPLRRMDLLKHFYLTFTQHILLMCVCTRTHNPIIHELLNIHSIKTLNILGTKSHSNKTSRFTSKEMLNFKIFL